MTESELSTYRFLVKEVERLRKTMDETLKQEYIAYKSPVITGLPHGSQISDSTFCTVVNASKARESQADRNNFSLMLASIERRIEDIQNFIYAIPDDRTRLVFQYKYFDGMTHEEVGKLLYYSEGNIRKIIKNYIKSQD